MRVMVAELLQDLAPDIVRISRRLTVATQITMRLGVKQVMRGEAPVHRVFWLVGSSLVR